MPKIVDREKKVKEICKVVYKEFVKHGMENISLNQIITNMGMSKGQFYHYFKTKEELIFEVMSHKMMENIEKIEKNLKTSKSVYEGLMIVFTLYVSEERDAKDLRKLFFDSLHVYAHSLSPKVKQHNKEYYEWLDKKLMEVFASHNIKGVSDLFIRDIIAAADGMYLRSLADHNFNLQSELAKYLKDISS